MKLKTLIAGRLRVPSDEGQDENESFESAEEQPLETMDFEEMIRKTERLLKTIDNELKTFGERKKAVAEDSHRACGRNSWTNKCVQKFSGIIVYNHGPVESVVHKP